MSSVRAAHISDASEINAAPDRPAHTPLSRARGAASNRYMYIVYIHIYIYIYIYIYLDPLASSRQPCCDHDGGAVGGAVRSRSSWLRTNVVSTDETAAKVMNLPDRKKGTPWHFLGKTHLTGVPKSLSAKRHEICSDPIRVDPMCPFPSYMELS